MRLPAYLSFLLLLLFIAPVFSQNPTANLTSPTAGQILSNVANNGSTIFPITGTATDTDFQRWELHYKKGAGAWVYITGGSTPVVNGTFTQWQTQALVAGNDYTVRLRAYDIPQNFSEHLVAVKIGHLSMSQNVEQFNPGASGTVTYTTIVPAPFTQSPYTPLTQTIEIKNQAGTLVRTLVSSVQRTAGTYNDVWDGKNNQASLLPEGAYFYTSYLVYSSSSMTWDVSNQFVGGTPNWNEWLFGPTSFDSFNNLPWNYSFDLESPARITLLFSPDNETGGTNRCPPPIGSESWNYCEYVERYAPSGLHFASWLGIDNTGALRPDLKYGHIEAYRSSFQKNAVVLFGVKPTILNLALTPPVYAPSTGQNQTISFNLTTYQNQAAPTVVISIKNFSSNTVVRTITMTNVSAGNVNNLWDGKADNGKYLSPDVHLVTVTVTDAIGGQALAQIFTTIRN